MRFSSQHPVNFKWLYREYVAQVFYQHTEYEKNSKGAVVQPPGAGVERPTNIQYINKTPPICGENAASTHCNS